MSTTTSTTNEGAAPGELSHREILRVLSGLILAMFVAMLSQSVVAPALPTIAGELAGQDKLPWIMTAQLLSTTASTPLWGKLSDLYGRKRLFQLAIVIFLIGSSLSGLSDTIGQLIAARVVQGIGGGGLLSGAMTIMGTVLSPRQRGRYMGYFASVMLVSSVGGPLVGGFIVDSLSWRWCFFIAIPFGVTALAVIQRNLHLPRQRAEHVIDYLGAALLVGAVSSTVTVTSLGGRSYPWGSPFIVSLGVAGVVLLVALVARELTAPEPIIPPRLFRSRNFTVAVTGAFIVGLAMFSAVVFLPQYFQVTRGVTPTRSGMLMLPQVLGMMGTSVLTGRRITSTGRYRWYPVAGMACIATALLLLSRLGVDTPFLYVAVSMVLLGVGMGLVFQVLMLVAQNSVDWGDLGTATSTTQFFQSIGGSVGVPVFGAILNNRLDHHLPLLLAERAPGQGVVGRALLGSPQQIHALPAEVRDAVMEAFARSIHTVFLVGAPCAVVGFLLVLLIRETPLREDSAMSLQEAAGAAATDRADDPVTAPAAAPA